MTNFLAIDASTYVGSVAILTDSGALVAEAEAAMRGAEEERLMPAVAALVERSGISPSDLAGVICGAGPGSFTSLRIAASIAKGMASGLGIPLFAVSSLLLIPAGVSPAPAPGHYLALLDAMRGDFHALRCTVSARGQIDAVGEVTLCSSDDLSGTASGSQDEPVEIGPGRAIDAFPRARGVARLMARILAGGPVDIGNWEPLYGRLAEAEVRLRAATSNSALQQS